MGTRDHYRVSLKCIVCGRSGTAHWSEWDRPTVYSGNGRRLESVSDGFIVGSDIDKSGDPQILCAECGVPA